MRTTNQSSISHFLEANLQTNWRAALYSLPLFIHWIIGITFEKQPIAYQAARRSMFLSLAFLALTGVFYFTHGFIRYFSGTAEFISSFLFFILQTMNVLVYIGISTWQAFNAFKGETPPIPEIEKKGIQLESFLSR